MDVVLLSIAMVTVVGAIFALAVIIPARRRGAALVNRQTVRALKGQRAPRRPRRRRRLGSAFGGRTRPQVDLTPLLSQGMDSAPRSRRPLSRAS